MEEDGNYSQPGDFVSHRLMHLGPGACLVTV